MAIWIGFMETCSRRYMNRPLLRSMQCTSALARIASLLLLVRYVVLPPPHLDCPVFFLDKCAEVVGTHRISYRHRLLPVRCYVSSSTSRSIQWASPLLYLMYPFSSSPEECAEYMWGGLLSVAKEPGAHRIRSKGEDLEKKNWHGTEEEEKRL
ncbi:hypothetical protein CPB85DRAFT_105063 [Mucidula mucida]|nr:hypothetical protein CPB85DRAFT_105063 [Mucidula mucida]